MKLSTRTRYGTRIMVDLGRYYRDKPVLLKDIAKDENLSEKYLSQIILTLKTAGLVKSFRGAKGGYSLAKDPKKINMREIITALDGDFNLVDCILEGIECPRTSICVTKILWEKLSENMSEFLENITLDELVEQYKYNTNQNLMYNI